MDDLAQRLMASLPETLRSGSSEEVMLEVAKINLTDGTVLSPPSSGVIAVVGPNNAGKSTLLRELYSQFGREHYQQPQSGRVIDSVEMQVSGTGADFIAWLVKHARVGRLAGSPTIGLMPLGAGSQIAAESLGSVDTTWAAATSGSLTSAFRPFLVHYADVETRLEQSKAAPPRADARDSASHALHGLEDDRTRLTKASQLAVKVFGEPLHLDDYSASRRLKVGSIDIEAPPRDSTDSAYRDSLLALPELAEQGDGMRSFFGQLLPLLARTYPIVLIDEPEAFLHPPQAAHLGRALGDLVSDNRIQLILATHDRNLLTGLLSSAVDLSVIRLDRVRGGTIKARQLSSEDLKKTWGEPSVRYSNALDGLFHRLVVLVEGDGDARFYAASLDASAEDEGSQLMPSDVLFVPCNGKGGMARLAGALVALGVPVVASPDFDILKDAGELRALVEAVGGQWQDISTNYSKALANVDKSTSPLRVADLVAALGPDVEAPLDERRVEMVRRFLSTAVGGWQQVKVGGISSLGGGGAGKAASELLDALDRCGVVALRRGELESLDSTLGVTKARWVAAALEANVHRGPEALTHIRRVVAAGVTRNEAST